MVGVGIEGNESSLARVSLVNYYGAVQLDEYVVKGVVPDNGRIILIVLRDTNGSGSIDICFDVGEPGQYTSSALDQGMS